MVCARPNQPPAILLNLIMIYPEDQYAIYYMIYKLINTMMERTSRTCIGSIPILSCIDGTIISIEFRPFFYAFWHAACIP